MYLAKFPRRILLDMTGEHEEKADVVALSTREFATALQQLAHKGKWCITLSLDTKEIPAFIRYLCPIPNLRESPIRAVGGAVLLVDEVDLIAPPRSVSEEVRTLYRRSRHVGLSIVSTTQRPAAVSREVSAQSQQAVALALNEPRDRDYMVDLMRLSTAQAQGLVTWVRRHPHGGLWKDLQTGQALWLPESGPPTREGPKPTQTSLVSDADEA